jgi:hypothetical protein
VLAERSVEELGTLVASMVLVLDTRSASLSVLVLDMLLVVVLDSGSKEQHP